MNFQRNLLRVTLAVLFLSALSSGLMPSVPLTAAAESAQVGSATLSPALSARLAGLANDVEVGMVIVAFESSNGLSDDHLNALP